MASPTIIRPGPVVGAYSVSLQTGSMTGVGANAPIFSARFNGSYQSQPTILVLRRIAIPQSYATTPFTVAQITKFGFYVARGFTASDTGGTTVSLTNNMYRSNQPASGIVDMRIAAAAALTPGTRTLDAYPFGAAITGLSTTPSIGGFNNEMEWSPKMASRFPVILQPNEGIVINNLVAMGAAGVVVAHLQLDWEEYINF